MSVSTDVFCQVNILLNCCSMRALSNDAIYIKISKGMLLKVISILANIV